MKKRLTAKRITIDAIMTALALIIFIVELQIPEIVPIPGVKLGLSNVISLIAIFEIGPVDAFLILIMRIFLGSMFSGRMISVAYSLAGGLLCFGVTLAIKRFVPKERMWVCSVIGAISHNMGQLITAVLITKTAALFTYLPILIAAAIITGAFTGALATLLSKRLHGLFTSY